jgi:hypothetical protein
MRLLPKDKPGKILFVKTHLQPWTEHAEQIGSSPELIAQLAAATEAARLARAAQRQAINAAQAATMNYNRLVDEMAELASAVVLQVRSKARTTGDSVYALASLPLPKKASAIKPPGKPSDFKLEANQDGSVVLRWTCKNPRGAVGTMYQVRRKLGDPLSPGSFEFLGYVGEKEFVDETIPPGTASLQYEVQAIRSTSKGPEARFAFNFGTDDATRKLLQMSRNMRAA